MATNNDPENDYPFGVPNKCIFQRTRSIPEYLPNIQIFDALKKQHAPSILCKMSPYFADYIANKKLTPINYCNVLKILLNLEDAGCMKVYTKFIAHNVDLENERHSKIYTMNVKNFPIELKYFDEVLIIPQYLITPDTPANSLMLKSGIEGVAIGRFEYIERLRHQEIENDIVKYWKIHFYCGKKLATNQSYTIVFRPERTLISYQQETLNYLNNNPDITKLMFPNKAELEKCKKIETSSLTLFNKKIYTNPEQLEAVINVLSGCAKIAPYIIIGPPGTGKTTTIAEIILQLYKNDPKSKILVTAASNSSCDEIAFRLLHYLAKVDSKRTIARIYSRFIEHRIDYISEELIGYSNLWTDDHFYPSVEILHEYRIVVCTLSIVGKLATGDFGLNADDTHVYSHIFVDDAASSTEPEILMSLSKTYSKKTTLILSGDPKQLGPVIRSDRAIEFGLANSLMERLLNYDFYGKSDNYNRDLQTRLCRNYRSHPEILKLYNELYYEKKLMPLVKEGRSLTLKWSPLINSEYPIIFHDVVNGNCVQDRRSHSFSNVEEAKIVMTYVFNILKGGLNIEETDIGIVTPYAAQTLLLEELLNKKKLQKVEVGTVHSFQGKEKKVIIATLVRAKDKQLGFIAQPRRINVLLSRAKSLLVIVGNSTNLMAKPNDFQHVMKECKENRTFVSNTNHLKIDFSYGDSLTNLMKKIDNLAIANKNKNRKSAQKKRQRQRKRAGKQEEQKQKQQGQGQKQQQQKQQKQKPSFQIHFL